jgi:cyclopropane-fatty-acyl-phospholipid synthase
MAWLMQPLNALYPFKTRNHKHGSRSNISAHYDLGNAMYGLFLDAHMQYSSAVYKRPEDTLADAQVHKLQLICEKLQLCANDHLLEVGTGWGGLAIYAAKHYGCKVTTTTLSQEQFNYAQAWIAREGLEDQITLLLSDYRDLTGSYDKLVSVEMIEAVGHQFLPGYFEVLNRLLKPHGRLLIQAITIADQRYHHYQKNTDFIQKYIFPGGLLPSIERMTQCLSRHTNMTLTRLQSYGHDYARTLQAWRKSFVTQSDTLRKQGYSETFERLWDFYFCYCEGAFLEGSIDLVHFEAVKPGAKIAASDRLMP